jgi:hypothetical protein
MCAADPLYYFNTCLWTFASHDADQCPDLPFITYDYQDELILKIIRHVELMLPLNIKKARDMGASWTCLGVGRWLQKFRRKMMIGLLSWKEDYVDRKGSMDALMPKVDYFYDHELPWMKEDRTRNDMVDKNNESGGAFVGETANANAFRAGRPRVVFWDEAATTRHAIEVTQGIANATGCLIRIYTPRGRDSDPAAAERAGIETVELPWTIHPLHTQGLYKVENGRAVVIDKSYRMHKGKRFPEDYKFVTTGPTVRDGMFRSPWYDEKCVALHNIPLLIAQELDMNDTMSSSLVFDSEFLNRAEAEFCRAPLRVCKFKFSRETLWPDKVAFIDDASGEFKIWEHFVFGEPKRDRTYTVSCDVAMGSGASNSTLVVTDDLKREKIVEFASPTIKPHEFAHLAIAVCRYFKDQYDVPALLVWEQNGPGGLFGAEVVDSGFTNVWYEGEKKGTPGWFPTKQKKIDMLGQYGADQMEGKYIDRSFECVAEQRKYVVLPDQSVDYVDHSGLLDPSGARTNHGDRVIATALGNMVSKKRHVEQAAKEAAYPEGSRGWRNEQRAKKEAREKRRRGWDRYARKRLTGAR